MYMKTKELAPSSTLNVFKRSSTEIFIVSNHNDTNLCNAIHQRGARASVALFGHRAKNRRCFPISSSGQLTRCYFVSRSLQFCSIDITNCWTSDTLSFLISRLFKTHSLVDTKVIHRLVPRDTLYLHPERSGRH